MRQITQHGDEVLRRAIRQIALAVSFERAAGLLDHGEAQGRFRRQISEKIIRKIHRSRESCGVNSLRAIDEWLQSGSLLTFSDRAQAWQSRERGEHEQS